MVVDLDLLKTLEEPVEFHISPKKSHFKNERPYVKVDQCVLVSTIIRLTNIKSNYTFTFPIQPSSAFKLPVKVGGIISTNASGIMSSGLGAAENWIKDLTIMNPQGEITTLTSEDGLFHKIVGGMGYYGVILNASFYLAQIPDNVSQKVIFGEKIDEVFIGLQIAQDKHIYPMICEFVCSFRGLFGKFVEYQEFIPKKCTRSMNWALIIKDEPKIVNAFEESLSKATRIYSRSLDSKDFSLLLEERTKLAILTLPGGDAKEYVRFPGFEDTLVQPKDAISAIEYTNGILKNHGIPPNLVLYGHVNFRRGQGILIHSRLPIDLNEYCEKPKETLFKISKIVSEIIVNLYYKYNILPKAEHTLGFLTPWLQVSKFNTWISDIENEIAFNNPHLIIYNFICRKFQKSSKAVNDFENLPLDRKIPLEIEILHEFMQYYLGLQKFDISLLNSE